MTLVPRARSESAVLQSLLQKEGAYSDNALILWKIFLVGLSPSLSAIN